MLELIVFTWNINHAEQVCSLVPRQHWLHGLSIGSWVSRAQWKVKMSLGLCSLFNLTWKHLSLFLTWKLQRSSHQLNSRIKMFNFRIKRDWFLLTKISSGEWNFSIFYETFYRCTPKFLYFLSHFICFYFFLVFYFLNFKIFNSYMRFQTNLKYLLHVNL